MFWKMSSIGWVIRPFTRVLLKAATQNQKKAGLEYFCPRMRGGWVGERKIIYVWDWSVSGDPIISWDVNYTVLSLHVKRQIIEEGKRCGTLYLCSHLLLGDFFFPLCPFSSLSVFSCFFMYLLLDNITLSQLMVFLGYYSPSRLWWVPCAGFTLINDLDEISEMKGF